MYYSKYDYSVLAEPAVEMPAINNTNELIKYAIPKQGSSYLYTKNSNIHRLSDSINTYCSEYIYYKILIERSGICTFKQKIVESTNSILKTANVIEIANFSISEPSPSYKLYLNGKEVQFTYTLASSVLSLTIISDISSIIKPSCNKYTFYALKVESPTILGFLSDKYSVKSQFFNMESLEGSFDYKQQHSRIKRLDNQSDSPVKEIIKEKKYSITIIEPEYQDSLLQIFESHDIIKIIKLYKDRIEEFYNCTLDNVPMIVEDRDVNKRTFSISCTDIFIRYFKTTDENTLDIGGIFID